MQLCASNGRWGFLEFSFSFTQQSHEANHKAIRYRVCQIIALTVDYIGNGELDNDLCDDIIKCMHARLSDKIPSVRVHAITALCRLQDPSDKHCPIIKGISTLAF